MITVLCGGVGAARFLRALRSVVAPSDVTAVVNRHYSQARAMRERAMEIERIRHGSVRGDAA